MSTHTSPPFRFRTLFSLVMVFLAMGATFFIGRETARNDSPQRAEQEQVADILQKVGSLIELPRGESPQVGVVENAAAIREVQPFLATSEDGDILIVYAEAKIALLYRPSAHKLIAVGPVSREEQSSSSSVPVIFDDTYQNDDGTFIFEGT